MSAEDGGPSWLEPATKDDVVLLNNAERGVGQLKGDASSSSSEGSSMKCYQIRVIVQWALRIATMMISVLMAATALIGLSSVNGIEATGRIFVAVYMLLFACLLFIFEFIQIKQIEYLDHILRRNVGFMFNTMGKAFFIIFVGFLSFGLGEPATLSFCTGLVFAGLGAGELALFLKFPEFFE